VATIVTLVLKGFFTWTTIGLFYCLSTYSIALNWIRNLAAHRYANTGGEMTFAEQVEESINIVHNSLVTLLLFPVGLRYHGLHHLFPSLPYHALGEAHRRLMKALPEDAPYRRTCCPGFFTALRDLLSGARRAEICGAAPMPKYSSKGAGRPLASIARAISPADRWHEFQKGKRKRKQPYGIRKNGDFLRQNRR
jgi:fatty acid desaturase